MDNDDPIVEGRGLTKWYGETTALDQVDLVVRSGVIHGLLGPNGAGKTTLLSMLFGLVLPDEGTVRLFGRSRADAGAGWLDGVGGFIESPRFYPYLSGRRNLSILAGLDGGDSAGLVEDMIELVGLGRAGGPGRAGGTGGAGGLKVRGYSLGMVQRLGLAAALLRRPRLLILDEPTNGMDPAGIRDLRSALRRLADNGLTVILSSHDMDQVEEICDAVTVLNRGRTAFAGRLDAMREEAPDPAWRVHTSADDAALAAARGDETIKASFHDDGGLLVLARQDCLDRYVIHLGRSGIAVRALTLDVTPLASMFFHLTEDAAAVAPDGREVGS